MTTSLIRPFRALRPPAASAAAVAAPPYDVFDADEARRWAAGRAASFLHVSRAEIDLEPGTDPHDAAVYRRAAVNLGHMVEGGLLVRDRLPSLYVYRIEDAAHAQMGLAATMPLPAGAPHRVRLHEATRPDKVEDRARQIAAVRAQTGPIMFAHQPLPAAAEMLDAVAGAAPADAVATVDGATHSVWVVGDRAGVDALVRAYDGLDALYVADGHHRVAAAAVVAAREGDELAGRVLGVAFPRDQLRILGYHRVVGDLCGQAPAAFLARLEADFAVEPLPGPLMPAARGCFTLYVDGGWFRLSVRHQPTPPDDITARLDVSILTDRVLGPILGIGDLRLDGRVAFVGGGRGIDELSRLVDSGRMAAGFALYPTAMRELMAVADAGGVMPPKSTWFDPKLADGLLSYVLDE